MKSFSEKASAHHLLALILAFLSYLKSDHIRFFMRVVFVTRCDYLTLPGATFPMNWRKVFGSLHLSFPSLKLC